MNTIVTSREAILRVSRELVQRQGWEALNMRAIAKECHISIGSIYNYFDSKSDLIASTVESVWQDIFHFPESSPSFDSFADCIEWAFGCMRKGDEKYPGFFTFHSMALLGEDKLSGRQFMRQSWKHIQDNLYMVLANDKNVRPEIFDESFSQKDFVTILFSLMLSALLQRNYDCAGILSMVRKVIYDAPAR